jgi:hypothetical protein
MSHPFVFPPPIATIQQKLSPQHVRPIFPWCWWSVVLVGSQSVAARILSDVHSCVSRRAAGVADANSADAPATASEGRHASRCCACAAVQRQQPAQRSVHAALASRRHAQGPGVLPRRPPQWCVVELSLRCSASAWRVLTARSSPAVLARGPDRSPLNRGRALIRRRCA